jgi:hypothetical protein
MIRLKSARWLLIGLTCVMIVMTVVLMLAWFELTTSATFRPWETGDAAFKVSDPTLKDVYSDWTWTDSAPEVVPCLVVEGRFQRHTVFHAELFDIMDGVGNRISWVDGGRSSGEISALLLKPERVLLGIETYESSTGEVCRLNCSGLSAAGVATHPEEHRPISSEFVDTFEGTVPKGKMIVAMVRGDRRANAASCTTLSEFSRQNPSGHFLVIMVGLD